MAQRCHHYEAAFEEYVRSRRIPYVAVDEARKTLLPQPHSGAASGTKADPSCPDALKSFDFVIYGQGGNLLVEIKGRRVGLSQRLPRLENWATREDIESLLRWEVLFGDRFEAAIVFVYHYHEQPPDALFEELFTHQGLWYGLRVVMVREYAKAMRSRSPKWGTVDLARSVFEAISTPFSPRTLDARREAAGLSCDYGDRLPALQLL